MRREIHKAKRIDTKEWVYGNYVETETLDGNGMEYFIIEKKSNGSTYPVMYGTIDEWTGKTDNNKAIIFTGDIVKVDNLFIRVVIFDEERACYGLGKPVKVLSCQDPALAAIGYLPQWDKPLGDYASSQLEVIGNVYDNRGLLEGRGND